MNSLPELGKRTLVMGVLNVTPDSFSDGGRYLDASAALDRAMEMVDHGADIIDVGGESTRPSTFNDGTPLEIDEELRRIIPVIERIKERLPTVPISVDTYKAVVAKRAVNAGASIINDVSGLTYDIAMAFAAAWADCPVVIMHLPGQPRNLLHPDYVDVIVDITSFFSAQIAHAVDAGVDRRRIILDPGIGFGKNTEHNLAILRRLGELKALGYPLLIGPSRKRFLGSLLDDAPTDRRIEGTSAAVAIGIANGADIVRVHDVREIAKVVKVSDAIVRGKALH